MTTIQGHGASAGVTCGPLYLFRRPPAPVYGENRGKTPPELPSGGSHLRRRGVEQ